MLERTLRAQDLDQLTVDGYIDAVGNPDRHPADARHFSTSSFRHSPHVREDFATDAIVVSLSIGLQALRRRDDGDAETTKHLRESGRFGVHAKAGLGDPAYPGNGTLPVLAVLQGDRQRFADLAFCRLVHGIAGDVALVGEDLGD